MNNNKKKSFVSIIVCIYNEEKYLQQCINALLKQNYPKEKYEIIVIDDGSEDASPEICKKAINNNKGRLPFIQYALIQHSGISVGRNTGAYLSQGDIIAYIDGDAVADKNWITELVKAFGNDKTIGVVGGKIEVLNNKNFIPRFIHIARHCQFFGPKIFKNHLTAANLAFRKDVFKTLGGFYEEFIRRGEEPAFCNKVFKKYRFNAAPLAIVYHEMPSTFLTWLTLEYIEAYSEQFVEKTKNEKQTKTLRQRVSYIEKIFVSLFPVLGIGLLLFSSTLLLALFLISSLFMVRRYVFKLEQRVIYRKLFSTFKNPGIIFLFIVINWASTVLKAIGIAIGHFSSRKYQPKEMIPSGNKIIKILTNNELS